MTSYSISFVLFTATIFNSRFIGGEHFTPRIIGGDPADNGQFPYQLSLRWYDEPKCGAVLVTSSLMFGGIVALTAAHCVKDRITGEDLPPSAVSLMGGSVFLDDKFKNSARQILRVRKIVTHENYNRSVAKNDIAILFLSPGELTTNKYLKPIKLPHKNENYEGLLRISGWGFTTEDADSNHLQFADVPVVSNEKCTEQYAEMYNNTIIFGSSLCAGYENGSKDTCNGDSGDCSPKTGPGVGQKSNGQLVLFAITSWGQGCADPRFPGVYVRVSSYVNWIKKQVVTEPFFIFKLPHLLSYFSSFVPFVK